MSWYEEAFGEKLVKLGQNPLNIPPGEKVTVKVVSDHVELIETTHGRRPAVLVKVGGATYTLYLSAKSLARPFAFAEMEHLSLKGLTFKIRRPTGEEEDRYYSVELIE